MHRFAPLLLALGLPVVGCGSADDHHEPSWRRLAVGFEPSALAELEGEWETYTEDGEPIRLERGSRPHEWRLRYTIRGDQWIPYRGGIWSAPRPIPILLSEQSEKPRFTGDGVEHTYVQRHFRVGRGLDAEVLDEVVELAFDEPGFTPSTGRVYLVLAEGQALPERSVVEEVLSLGHEENESWRVPLLDLIADAIPVLSASKEVVLVDLPAASALRFGTLAFGGDRAEGAPPARFRVWLDDELVLEHDQRIGPRIEPIQHELILPRGVRIGAHLTFEVEGQACVGAFLTPTLGPADIGTPDARSSATRPDVVFFVADTFRADNLAAWGGDPQLTRSLNRLAEESVRFLSAQSPATWTLPAHASFFSGLYPRQTGVRRHSDSLSGAAYTIAEHLAAEGYRTVAITERGLVSRTYGLAQGFEWFEEAAPTPFVGVVNGTAIERTVERALERAGADDGRPLFLFVQSYRPHTPYRVTEETRERLGSYGLEGLVFEELYAQIYAAEDEGEAAPERGVPFSGRRQELVRAYEGLYRGACADLDDAFGRLLAGLEGLGLQDAALVFTSDHGESFGEHGVLGHGVGVWNEEARVPLLVRAPGLAPRDEPRALSLTSLPRMICSLAGLEPYSGWLGHDGLDQGEWPAAPVATYQCGGRRQGSDVGLVETEHKLILPDRPSAGRRVPTFAYRLAVDPDELVNEVGRGWARALMATWAPVLAAMDLAMLEVEEAALDATQEAQLRELGYLGDD